jgi:hypothetical protein
MATIAEPKKRKADELEGDISGEEAPKRQKVTEDGETSQDSSSKKRQRRKVDYRPKNGTFILEIENMTEDVVKEIVKSIAAEENQEDYPGAKGRIIKSENVRILPSDAEKKEERKKYRREYNRKPENIEKRRLKAQSPEEIEKRKKNNEDPAIQERKKECASGRRKTLRAIKDKHPEIYNQFHSQFVKPIPAEKKKSRRKRKEESMDTDTTSSSSTSNTSTTTEGVE